MCKSIYTNGAHAEDYNGDYLSEEHLDLFILLYNYNLVVVLYLKIVIHARNLIQQGLLI